MRQIILTMLLFVACQSAMTESEPASTIVEAQILSGQRYLDSIFVNVLTLKDVQYCAVYNPYKNIMENLKLDIYRPANDTATNRRAIIFVYGGGFWQGNKSIPLNVAFCKTLAKTGYVVFAIEYRKFPHQSQYADSTLRINLGSPMVGSDVRAAVCWLRTKTRQYRIAAEKIAVLGTSSGGFGAMSATYDHAIDSLNGVNGNNGTPNLCIVTSGGMPLGEIDRIENGEPELYLAHCLDDPIPFLYAQSIYARAQFVGIGITNWWIDGNCHGAIKCCYLDFFTNITQWLYTRF